jgi:hypothetical protein
MKAVLVLALVAAILTGCYSTREIQVEMVSATLVRIDTVNRETQFQKQLFTWRDQKNIEYTSFESMNKYYVVGTTMTELRTR